MKAITLTEEHKSKLLEMCKELFPEYQLIRFHSMQGGKLIGFLPNGFVNGDFLVHWFEFCFTTLRKKIGVDYDDLFYGTFSSDSSSFEHPVDTIYEIFLDRRRNAN